MEMWPISYMAAVLGAPEPAIRLILSIVIVYPMATVYRHLPADAAAKRPPPDDGTQPSSPPLPRLQLLALATSGCAILLFNYAADSGHALCAIGGACCLMRWLRGRQLATASYLFHMGYLLAGYWSTASATYDFTWTMPHCVLTLRLIGLAVDVADATQSEPPGVLATFAYALFPASVLVGPQFPWSRFEAFVRDEWDIGQGGGGGRLSRRAAAANAAGWRRGLLGAAYLLANQMGAAWLPDAWLEGDEFAARSAPARLLWLAAWGKVTLWKYVGCWLLAEGAAIAFGLGWSGGEGGGGEGGGDEAADGNWTGVRNVNVVRFENASRFQHYVGAFNVNTNLWCGKYVFRRLRFLGSKAASQAGALAFLAVWHGLQSGYYVCFAMEFVVMAFEKALEPIILRNERLISLAGKPYVAVLVWLLLKAYTLIGIAWCLVAFVFLRADRWWPIYRTLDYFGFWFFGAFPIWRWLLIRCLPAAKAD